MAVVLVMNWAGITPDMYDAVLEKVDWENQPAKGGIFHAAWFDDAGMHVADAWESEEDWNAFMAERLGPVLAELNIPGEPDASFHEVHRYFNTEAAQTPA